MNLETLTLPLEVADKAFNTAIGAAVAGVTAVVGAMGMAVKATFDWANQLDSIGDVMDVTNSQAAALNFVLRKSGTSTETFTKGVVILSKGLVKADGSLDTVGKSLEAWGVNVFDANGKLKSQNSLLDDVAKKYGTFSTQQEKVNFLTEVFGRNGAEMVDFFDTLAGEGGIDDVTKKVEALGLAIDPSRYENFNRNLEELKMVGLGLAVTFTESVMPALEAVLQWGTDFAAASPEEKFSMIGDVLKSAFDLTGSFKDAVQNVDWAGLSADLAAKIQSVDWANVGQIVRTGVLNVIEGIKTIVSEIDWKALATSTGEALKGLIAGLAGYPDWKTFAKDFNDKLNGAFDYLRNYSMEQFKEDWSKFIEGLKNALQTFLQWAQAQAAATPGRNVQGGWTTPVPVNGGRASGGPVIAGQTYNVSEFFRPERFTPQMNGRIDPIGGASTSSENLTPILQQFAYEIAMANRDAFEKAARR